MKKELRIASGQGYWGDLPIAPFKQVTEGEIDYLVMDYLAEVTMSIMQKQKNKNPDHGYARDLPGVMKSILPVCMDKNIKVITNGGGVNPRACAEEVLNIARDLDLNSLKIAVIEGDNILDQLDYLINDDCQLNNMETGEPILTVRDKLLSANVYLGAFPIVEALQKGADIVITGRTTDTGLTLAPMIYEFGWKENEYDLLAAGTVAGHILECGAQGSGGNLLAGWQSVEGIENIGFPIVVAKPDGEFYITKHESLGGKVSFATVAEQLVYEIGDPKEYITPDCVVDFTSIKLEDLGDNKVRVYDIKGLPATDTYKVSASYSDGYSAEGGLTYSWPQALTKAKAADAIIRKRLEKLGLQFDEILTEYIGYNSCHGPLSKDIDEDLINEIRLRIAVRSHDKKSVEDFAKEIGPLVLTGPPSVTGFAGGRAKPSEVVAYFPALIKKELVEPQIDILEMK